MKTLCFAFQVHQPVQFRKYRFFEIGKNHYYFDDYANDTGMLKLAKKSYLPANKILLTLLKTYKEKFKVAFLISGITLEQMELYTPEVIASFQELAKTGGVEFLSGTWSQSLSSLYDKEIFEEQVTRHSRKIIKLFGQKPEVLVNTGMIYSDEIGEQVAALGYKGILTEGARHILGWKSPDFVYVNALNPRLKVLMRNFRLSDDLTFRFSNSHWSEFPLTAEKYAGWLQKLDQKDEVITLFMNYETFGTIQPKESGIFDFLKALPAAIINTPGLHFETPSSAIRQHQPISAVHVPYPVSWADEERDLSAWLGNELQKEACSKLYALKKVMKTNNNAEIENHWNYLQACDHFHYMSTKFFDIGQRSPFLNPYPSPYEAFINYMNILADFKLRLEKNGVREDHSVEMELLKKELHEKNALIKKVKAELTRLKREKRTGMKSGN
jgi:alpha-amylase